MVSEGERNELVYLEDIWDCIIVLEKYVSGIKEEAFKNDMEKQDTVVRRIEIPALKKDIRSIIDDME